MRVFTLAEPVFKTEPLFVLGCSHAKLGAYLGRRFRCDVGLDAGQCGQMFTFDRSPWRVVWTKRLDVGSALHECFHLVTRICQDKGIPIRAFDERNEFGDETAAYLYEFFGAHMVRRMGYRR